jgi:hypothetical protein
MEQAFEQQVKKELKSMDQRLYDLEEKMTSIDTKLTQVVDAILGNALTKSGGFVRDIEVLKEEIKELKIQNQHQDEKIKKQEDFKNKITWTIGIVIIVGVVLEYIVKLYTTIKS